MILLTVLQLLLGEFGQFEIYEPYLLTLPVLVLIKHDLTVLEYVCLYVCKTFFET